MDIDFKLLIGWLLIIFCCVMFWVFVFGFVCNLARADEIGTASWYSFDSCLKEGSLGIMANGKKMVDENLTAAAWGYKFGTKLRVTNLKNGKSIIVEVSDRGPAKRLVKQGRIIDLSKGAFEQLDSLSKGIIKIKVSVMQ